MQVFKNHLFHLINLLLSDSYLYSIQQPLAKEAIATKSFSLTSRNVEAWLAWILVTNYAFTWFVFSTCQKECDQFSDKDDLAEFFVLKKYYMVCTVYRQVCIFNDSSCRLLYFSSWPCRLPYFSSWSCRFLSLTLGCSFISSIIA